MVDHGDENVTGSASTTRRRALAAGAIALGAAAGTLLSRNAAEAHGTLHVDSATQDPAIHGNNTDTVDGPGGGGPGVQGTSIDGVGVSGSSDTAAGVRGVHTSQTEATAGVLGINRGAGAGVAGRAVSGAGVRGIAPADNPGVLAQSGSQPPPGDIVLDNGLALVALGHTILRPATAADGLAPGTTWNEPTLQVVGVAAVRGLDMPIGSGTILAKERVHRVTDAQALAGSHISVALVGAPATAPGHADVAVSWIERGAGSFRIHLTEVPDLDTPFTYIVVNP